MRRYKIAFFVLIGLLLVFAAAVAVLIMVDPAVYRNQLQTRAGKALGREFRIAGPIHLQRSLRPRIIVEDISIGNPEWAVGKHFATAEKVGLQVALLPLLRGDLKVLDVAFSGVDLFIEEGPDGANNFTFGNDSGRKQGVLPDIEQLRIKDTVIHFPSADDGSTRFEIEAARLWNIPGEPERIEARASAKEMTFNILLTADSPAELSGPGNPWSVTLDIEGPDMALALTGQMEQALKWQRGDYRIKISGQQADTLESLFGVDFPTSGPYELAAQVNKTEQSFRMTAVNARIQGPPGAPVMKIVNGEASGGQNEPLQLALQGRLGEVPFTSTFRSLQSLGDVSKTRLWPIEAQINLLDMKLNVDGNIVPTTAAGDLEFTTRMQGDTLDTLVQLMDSDQSGFGPYQLSFHTRIAAEKIEIDKLKGTIERVGPWQKLDFEKGSASRNEKGSVEAAITARIDNRPLSLVFRGGPGAAAETNKIAWPLKLEMATSGATIRGDGALTTEATGRALRLATRISGNRFESLGPLVGVSLPAIGKFHLSADLSSNGDAHEARNLRFQTKSNRFSGNVRWEEKTPRPLLTGTLSSKRLNLNEFDIESKPTSKKGPVGLLDRAIKLDILNTFDAKLDLEISEVANIPIAVQDVSTTLTLTNGELSGPFRAKLTGTPVEGKIDLGQRSKAPVISLEATAGKIDAGQTLKQLKIPELVTGTADAAELEASSTGKTLREMIAQPVFKMQIKPANLRYILEIIGQKFDFGIESVQLVANKDQPLTGIFSGMLRKAPFQADISTANLQQLFKAGVPLPLRASLDSKNVQFKIQGSIARPFEKQQFELEYELAGPEILGLDPLADFALPLRGEFRALGRVTRQGNHYTYEENLRVGKSDLKADITVLDEPPRPKISGSLVSTQIHMDDVKLIDVDKENATAGEKSRVIPDYSFPIDLFFEVDIDVDLKADRIIARLGELGEIVSKVSLQDGAFKSSHSVTGFSGARVSGDFNVDATIDPPQSIILIDAKDLDAGFLLSGLEVTDIVEGKIDLLVELSGSGATRYDILGNAAGRITIIGGPGRISGRRIDMWAADLVPTMLSSQWEREDVTETNCFVAHVKVEDGQAEIEDLLLDTQRITIAAGGILNLVTEELDVIVAPRPKRASLVSLANPVRIEGTLAEPEVSVTRLPRRGQMAGAGLLAGLINPAFLVFAFSDSGTGQANPCDVAVESTREAAGIQSESSPLQTDQ